MSDALCLMQGRPLPGTQKLFADFPTCPWRHLSWPCFSWVISFNSYTIFYIIRLFFFLTRKNKLRLRITQFLVQSQVVKWQNSDGKVTDSSDTNPSSLTVMHALLTLRLYWYKYLHSCGMWVPLKYLEFQYCWGCLIVLVSGITICLKFGFVNWLG